jgi:hypothetical protein
MGRGVDQIGGDGLARDRIEESRESLGPDALRLRPRRGQGADADEADIGAAAE